MSRRAVHFWASGRTPNAEHVEMIPKVLDVVREADRGSARANREALFEAEQGVTPFSLLQKRQFSEARDRLGSGPGRRLVSRRALSTKAKLDRRPPPPGARVEEELEEPALTNGRVRAGRKIRGGKRESSG